MPGRGGQGCAPHAPAEDKHKQRIESDVDNAAQNDAQHGAHGVALAAQGVVEHKTAGLQRGGEQKHKRIFFGIGEDGVRDAQNAQHGRKKAQPAN